MKRKVLQSVITWDPARKLQGLEVGQAILTLECGHTQTEEVPVNSSGVWSARTLGERNCGTCLTNIGEDIVAALPHTD